MIKFLLKAFLFLLPASLYAQNWIGISNGNYSGTNGIYLNPSSIVDSRLGGYVNFAGVGVNAYNNYISFNADHPITWYLKDTTRRIEDRFFKENLNGKDKVVNFSAEVRGPGFMVSLAPRHAIAVTSRWRNYVQAVDVAQPLARMMRWGLSDSTPAFSGGPDGLSYEQLYRESNLGVNVNSFAEIGFTYAAVLMDKEKHFLKAGVTYKYLAGLYTFYFKNEAGGTIEINGEDSLTFSNTNLSYGYVNEALYRDGDIDRSKIFGPNRIGKGYGLDLGVTYEYRPNYKDYRYTLDGKERWDKTENKYFIRGSATLMDVGRIRYNNVQYVQNNRLARNKVVTWGSLDTTDQIFEGVDSLPEGTSVFERFDRAAGKVFGFDNSGDEIISKLPTALNIQADVRVVDYLYVNVMWLQGLRKKGTIGMRQFSMLAVTPRFESRWFEFSVPLVLNNDYRNFTFGLFARLGPFYIGSDNLMGVFKSKNVNGLDVYAGMSLPLFKHNPRDKDRDGVSNKRDRCRNVPGTWEFMGCPDTDKDGVEDAKDECDTIPGPKEFNGCPDRDGDGVEDRKDSCVDVKGYAQFNGCPDTDEDGIPDSKDSCVYLKGLPQYDGCPDTDEDGIEDRKDDCPTIKGPAEFNGCPDTDGDGIRDRDDRCPDKPGLTLLKGCPDRDNDSIPDHLDRCPDDPGTEQYGGCPDTDKDGLPDNTDLCPLEPGPVENNGCPKAEEKLEFIELDEEEEKILREVFDNLEFETGKAIIRPESFVSLDELVELMKAKPEYRIYIAGHTDNVGQKKANQKLSLDRATSVKNYLVGKGITESRIKVEGFGDSRPIATNKTPEGRQRNRRVEFKVIK